MSIREVKYPVHIMESERGWGQRVDQVKEFDTQEEADLYVENFNKQNTSNTVPDWYMFALTAPPVIK